MKSPIFYLKSFILFLVVLFLNSCQTQNDIYYQKTYTEEETAQLSETLLNGAGTHLYYQGSVGERMIIHEGNKYNPNNAWGHREIGVPYLKRGMAHEANIHYEKAVEADPQEWLGYKAYCWLYFYRDYENVLKELDEFDAFTPDFVDYPQSTSVNYMRGLCHLGLGQYDQAIKFMNMHLEKEIEDVGHAYIDAMPYQLLAMSYQKNGQLEEADSLYALGISHNHSTSDLYYYQALNFIELNKIEEAKGAYSKAQEWYSKGGKNARPYVEEFYAIYQEDLNALYAKLY